MHTKVDDLKGRSRRYNLHISNITEGAHSGYDDPSMEKFVTKVIKDSLDIKIDSHAIRRAHRVGKAMGHYYELPVISG